jgi:hypothetical protein
MFMKTQQPMHLTKNLKKLSAALLLAAFGATSAVAEFVYVTGTPSNCTTVAECGDIDLNPSYNVNGDLVYNENGLGFFTTAISLAPGKPPTPGARAFSTIFTNVSNPDFGITISPTLSETGGVYKLYHVFTSSAGNVSTDVLLSATNVAGCTLSFTNEIDKFRASFGTLVGGMNVWQFIGYVTNAPDTSTPKITFYYESGEVDAGPQRRLLVDTFLFVNDNCTEVATVGISGTYSSASTSVVVTGVTNATAVKVYQYLNDSWTMVGEKTTDVTDGNNTVPVSGLTKGGQLAATQVVNGQEGCLWGIPTGVVVGEAQPRLRMALSLRDTTSSVVGERGAFGLGNIHFLGVTNRLTAAPGFPGKVIHASNTWQTVTFLRGEDFSNPTDPSVKWNSGGGDPVNTINGMHSNYYIIDAIAFAIDDLTSTGPHDIYIDTIQNGSVTFYGFEKAPANTLDYGFRAPGFSGTTSGLLAASPNSSRIVNNAAYEGTKSIRVQWAWNSTANTRWLRLTPNGVGDPVVDVREPITIRFLYVPSGQPMPPAPERPLLSVAQAGPDTVFDWVGGHRLQTSVDVTGVYTNVPQVLSLNTYTNITLGAFLGPWTNTFTEPTRFFRLLD